MPFLALSRGVPQEYSAALYPHDNRALSQPLFCETRSDHRAVSRVGLRWCRALFQAVGLVDESARVTPTFYLECIAPMPDHRIGYMGDLTE